MKNQTENDLTNLSFEQAYQELEQIVETLENNQGSLDESMALFERGQKLAKYCSTLLEKAQLKVRELNAAAPGIQVNE
ncbi:MAG: exodeoxyribonuclease VII small subunit [Anaerolineaceae bacterium]